MFILAIITIGSTIYSFIVGHANMQYKKKLNDYKERYRFNKEKVELINQLRGFYKSIFKDNVYGESTLHSIIEVIDTININYTFLNKETKECLNEITLFITDSCLPEVKELKQDSKYSLRRKINNLIDHIDKEDVLI